jgi:hypothetical protein
MSDTTHTHTHSLNQNTVDILPHQQLKRNEMTAAYQMGKG